MFKIYCWYGTTQRICCRVKATTSSASAAIRQPGSTVEAGLRSDRLRISTEINEHDTAIYIIHPRERWYIVYI